MRKVLLLLCIAFNFAAIAQPINDNCAAATVIPVQNAPCVTASPGTTVAATASTQTAFIPFAADDDVWYKFTTPAGGAAGSVKVIINVVDVVVASGSAQSVHLERRDGGTTNCDNYYPNSTTLSPTGGNWTMTGLNPSTEYSIRVYTDDNTSRMTFGICAYIPPVPANDDCAAAVALTPQALVGCVGEGPFNTLGATASSQSSGDASGKDDDVWFKFTTAATTKIYSATIREAAYNSGSGNAVIELWDGCGASTFVNWYPFTSSANFGGLTPSTTYYVRVYTYGSSSRFSSFKICISEISPPSNDECADAISVTVNTDLTCSSVVAGTTYNATSSSQSMIPCTTPSDDDVWYKFIAPSSGMVQMSYSNVASTSGNMFTVLYGGGTCGSLTNMKCIYNETEILSGLTPGATYYLRTMTLNNGERATFDLCLKSVKAPVNDECAKAVNVPVNANLDGTLSVSGTTYYATGSVSDPIAPCTPTADDDVWFKFTAPGTGVVLMELTNVASTSGGMYAVLYNGTCGSLMNPICINAATETIKDLTFGQVYYLRILTNNTAASATFTLSLKTVPSTGNNSCPLAISLTSTEQQGSTFGLTTTNALLCGGGSPTNKLLWYSFTATATTHLVNVYDIVRLTTNQNNLGYRVYSGSCASLTSILCVDNINFGNQKLTGLTIGNTYYVQLMENSFNGGPVAFKIKLSDETPPSNDEGTGATTIRQNPTCESQSGTFKFSTMSATPISGTYSGDVWYKFVAATTTGKITYTAVTFGTEPRIVVHDGTASAPSGIFYDPGTLSFEAGTLNAVVNLTGMTIGNTYFIRVYNANAASLSNNTNFSICVSGLPTVVAADAATPGACQVIDGPVTSTNSNRWLHLTHQGKLLASVLDNPGGGGMGLMNGKYFINTGNVRTDAGGVEYMDRNFEITPNSQPTNPVRVRLYFTKAEFDAMVSANDGDLNDVLWLSDLKIAKFSSAACNSTINLTGEELYNLTGWGSIAINVYYIEMQIPSFSSFFLKNVNGGALPVTCGGFNYARKNNSIQLNWSTHTENNASHFELQRSADGRSFSSVATIPAKGFGSAYSYTDAAALNTGTYFYRLLQVDKDGRKQFACNTLKVAVDGTKQPLFGNLYPNPAYGIVNLTVERSYTGKVKLQIVNGTGQVVQTKEVVLQPSDNKISINASALPTGVYMLRVITGEEIQTIKFSKQ